MPALTNGSSQTDTPNQQSQYTQTAIPGFTSRARQAAARRSATSPFRRNHPRETAVLESHIGSRWILRARDRDRDILARLRFGHRRQVNRGCPIPVAGVQTGTPGKSSQSVIVIVIVFILVFLVGHPRFTCRRCPNLNLAKISLSLSRLKSTHRFANNV